MHTPRCQRADRPLFAPRCQALPRLDFLHTVHSTCDLYSRNLGQRALGRVLSTRRTGARREAAPSLCGRRPALRPISVLRFWTSGGLTQAESEFQGVEFSCPQGIPRKFFESTSLSRDNLRREIGRIALAVYMVAALTVSSDHRLLLGGPETGGRVRVRSRFSQGTKGSQGRGFEHRST